MPLWKRYQQCLVTTDLTELVLIIDQFERVMPSGSAPPSWMRAWGHHVTNQPLRTAVHPQALGAACTLRAAAVMIEAEHLMEARALYQRVLARYSSRDWAYYVDQAKEALAGLHDSAPAVVAFRPDRALPREDDDLLDHATQPQRRARIPLPCRLLLAQSGSGVPGMAPAAGNPDAIRAIRSCADIGRTRRSVCRALDVMECA
jgi:hypothetical protein